MKVSVVVLVCGVVCGASIETDSESVGEKEKIRVELKNGFAGLICPDGVQNCCPRELTPDEIEFGTVKANQLVSCINATVDRFIDLADDDVVRTDFRDVDSIKKYIRPICEVFDSGFACVRDVEPALDMCLSPRETVFKNKIFSIVPLLQSTVCFDNGDLVADIVEHEGGLKCLAITAEWIGRSGAWELLFSDTTELFGSEKDCREFNGLRQDAYSQLEECSVTVLNLIAVMSKNFCEGTRCERFITDLECN